VVPDVSLLNNASTPQDSPHELALSNAAGVYGTPADDLHDFAN